MEDDDPGGLRERKEFLINLQPKTIWEMTEPELVDYCFTRGIRGDKLEFAKVYFDEVVKHAEKNRPTFMGHLDLLTKYSSFDEENEAYRKIVGEAIAEIIKYVPTFEVSAGPIIRGLKDIPYPNPQFLSVIKKLGGRVILSSDAHAPDKIAYNFPALLDLVRAAGFEKVSRFADGKLVEDGITTLQ